MAKSTRQYVFEGMELLPEALIPFVEKRLESSLKGHWQLEVVDRVNGLKPNSKGDVAWDQASLLKTMMFMWKDAFATVLGHPERSYVSELLDVRNKLSHNETFTYDDAERALDTMRRLMEAISAGETAAEISKMRETILRTKYAELQRNEERRKTQRLNISVETVAGLLPWREVVEPHQDVATGEFLQAEFAADLGKVHAGSAPSEYSNPKEFFSRTYLTEGLSTLLAGAAKRLSQNGGDPVVELQTNFGGGKTHSMLALYHKDMSFAMLIFPRVWDWYVQWRERRRGFFTRWECDMLRNAMALVRSETGWLRQHPEIASRLVPVAGLISAEEVDAVRADWPGACDFLHAHAGARVKEVERVARIHRDPFEPILPILEASSPVAEYLKIADEILKVRPDARRYPRAAAEVTRSYLLIRLGLHLGLRQKNLRQLMVCPRGHLPRSERQLEALKRGEIRWSERDEGWEVFVPAVAFKNAHSSFFAGKPFRLVLPDLGGLYEHISAYIERHRPALLNGAADPGTFFVKTVKTTSRDASYNQNTFYEAWRLVIQRYGVFNPYTGRGAIKGLLPHGPHNVRDVLATHILKHTGSYEQASYAIQDTPDMVAKHYGRFLPQDKAAMAAQILNRVWEAA